MSSGEMSAGGKVLGGNVLEGNVRQGKSPTGEISSGNSCGGNVLGENVRLPYILFIYYYKYRDKYAIMSMFQEIPDACRQGGSRNADMQTI
jgi:hypothetical protein